VFLSYVCTNLFPPFLLLVIKFLEVYERSFCRTIETLVDIFQEYPDEVEYIFKPSCVPLMRCAGCCGDEGLECVPVDVYNVTMEVRAQLASWRAWLEEASQPSQPLQVPAPS